MLSCVIKMAFCRGLLVFLDVVVVGVVFDVFLTQWLMTLAW